ncbi:ABC transporter ATP-binding protein [Nocardiopsis dassonvillei]
MPPAAIEVKNLKKRYKNHVAVRDVSFTVEEGEIFGILGPNGAGKTTTVECIEGLRTPDGGSVSVRGLNPVKKRGAVREVLGAQLQESQLPEGLRVEEAVRLFSSFYKKPVDGDALIRDFGLEAKRKTAFSKLSGGQKQRLSIILSLIGGPKVVILDELTTGLDPQARRETWGLIEKVRSSGVTVLLVTHFMEEAERLCDRIALINRGEVVALDTPEGLKIRAGVGKKLTFHASREVPESLLLSLPEVEKVEVSGRKVSVEGEGNLLDAVSRLLAAESIQTRDMNLRQATLDDAFLALTGKKMANESQEQH